MKRRKNKLKKQINGVRGPIDIDSLGVTLTHEHLWLDVAPLYKRAHPDLVMTDEKVTKANRAQVMRDLHSIVFEYEDNLSFTDVDMTVKELEPFKAAGGQTIIEVSTADIARNPLKLREIAEKSNINVIMGGSWYWFPSLDDDFQDFIMTQGKNKVADILIKEIYEGVGDTGIKPGVIGEVGNGDCEGTDIIYHAVAIAQKETGLPVICHSPDLHVLDIAEKEGADLSKYVMGHWSLLCPMEEAFKRGAFVSVDQFGMNFPGVESDDERIGAVLKAFELGYQDKLLLSQDVCWKVRLKQFGGGGYAEIFNSVVTKMRDKGINDAEINRLFTDNVKRLFM